MRHPAPLVAATVAVTLLFGVGTAAAEDPKPVSREAAKLPAVDADVAAAAARIDADGSALGSYWDPERRELVVVVGPDSAIGEPEAEKLVGGPYRLEQQKIARKTADGIREELASREFGPAAEKYGYSSHLDLQSGKVVVESAVPEAFEGLLKEHPDEVELRESKPLQDTFHRRDDTNPFWGGASIQSGGATCSTGFSVRKPSGVRFITTAAHCYGVGATVRTPTGTLVGSVTQRGTLGSIFFWNNRDVELIGGQTYAARVYTGGVTSTSSKAVVGAGDPVAGFTVRKPSGARLITTAAHCYGVGATVRTPTSTFVGSVTQRGTLGSIFFWDNRDVELIGGSSYAPRVYTGGVFSTSSRGVVGAGDPVAGFRGYCSSGQTSGEQCNQKVESTQAIVCTQTGCKWPVIEYTGGPARPGDSGGSFYLPSGSTQAHARGAVIAGDGTTSYAEKWSRMSSSMGVSIAT